MAVLTEEDQKEQALRVVREAMQHEHEHTHLPVSSWLSLGLREAINLLVQPEPEPNPIEE
jgi:hypothetical protein